MTTLDIDTLEYLEKRWDGKPGRIEATRELKRITTTARLSNETTGKTFLRSGLQRAEHIAFARPVHSKTEGRIREWLINIFGVLLVLGFLSAVCTFAAAFNPLYDSTQTTITD